MRVLVTFASRHGATAGIAEAIGTVIREAADGDLARRVDVLPIEDVEAVEDYDAVLVGSAVYLGRWLGEADEFVRRHARLLVERPVWLFSSGPVGHPAVPAHEASDVAELGELCGARSHRTFAGCLRWAELSHAERLAIRQVHAAEGDYRDWADIRSWAKGVAESLAPTALS